MIGLNIVAIEGGLTRDSEMKYTQGGTAFVNFSLGFATYQKGVNDRNEKNNYVDVTLFGKQAEAIKQYLVKGAKVSVQGKLDMSSWQDQQSGQQRTKIGIIADSVHLQGGGNRQNNNVQNNGFQQQNPQQNQGFQQQPMNQGFQQNPQYQQQPMMPQGVQQGFNGNLNQGFPDDPPF